MTPTGVSIAFTVASKEEAAASIINLRSFDCFSDVLVTAISEVVDDETKTSHVELTAECTYGVNPALEAEATEAETTEAGANEETTEAE